MSHVLEMRGAKRIWRLMGKYNVVLCLLASFSLTVSLQTFWLGVEDLSNTENGDESFILPSSLSMTPKTNSVSLQDVAIIETTKIFYASSRNLPVWLSRSREKPFTIFIYETLDQSEFSVKSISQCIEEKFNADGSNNCGWYPAVCDENTSGTFPYYNLYRTNFNNDIVILQRFLEYEHRVDDPSKADIFIVPYAHKSHCLCKQQDATKIMCSYNFQYIKDNVFLHLKYYNDTTRRRHLFILGSDWNLANPPLRRQANLQLTLGPAQSCTKWGLTRADDNCGSLVVPYVNTASDYQPNKMADRSMEWWLERPRKYGLAAIMGSPKHLTIRRKFFDEWRTLIGEEVGGLPVHMVNNEDDRNLKRHDVAMEIYQDSIFCPILAGDDCGQKRFFDVAMSGCIPVVLSYENTSSDMDDGSFPSWFKPNACSIRHSYPFARGSFAHDQQAGIDYKSFVIQVDGRCGLGCFKNELEAVFSSKEQLSRLRYNLWQYSRFFSYRLDPGQSHRYPDAFSALLVRLRHYVASLLA